jgi:hypothetical protein
MKDEGLGARLPVLNDQIVPNDARRQVCGKTFKGPDFGIRGWGFGLRKRASSVFRSPTARVERVHMLRNDCIFVSKVYLRIPVYLVIYDSG